MRMPRSDRRMALRPARRVPAPVHHPRHGQFGWIPIRRLRPGVLRSRDPEADRSHALPSRLGPHPVTSQADARRRGARSGGASDWRTPVDGVRGATARRAGSAGARGAAHRGCALSNTMGSGRADGGADAAPCDHQVWDEHARGVLSPAPAGVRDRRARPRQLPARPLRRHVGARGCGRSTPSDDRSLVRDLARSGHGGERASAAGADRGRGRGCRAWPASGRSWRDPSPGDWCEWTRCGSRRCRRRTICFRSTGPRPRGWSTSDTFRSSSGSTGGGATRDCSSRGRARWSPGACLSSLVFAATLPFNAARLALAIQLQPSRIFWMLDFLAVIYVVWAAAEGVAADARRARMVALAIVLLSTVRGAYIMLVEFPDRRVAQVRVSDDDWGRAMAWARGSRPGSGWLADPGHAARYGTSVRVAAERDVFVEAIKDGAVGMYRPPRRATDAGARGGARRLHDVDSRASTRAGVAVRPRLSRGRAGDGPAAGVHFRRGEDLPPEVALGLLLSSGTLTVTVPAGRLSPGTVTVECPRAQQ